MSVFLFFYDLFLVNIFTNTPFQIKLDDRSIKYVLFSRMLIFLRSKKYFFLLKSLVS